MSDTQAQEVLETVLQKQPRRRGCLRGCVVYGGAAFLLLAFLVWRFCIATTPLQISKETTYVLGPLAADGKQIDYFRAWEEHLYPAEMKTDENGYRIFVREIGDTADRSVYDTRKRDPKTMIAPKIDFDPEPLRVQVYEKLGLDPNVKPTKKLESPDAFLGRLARDDESGNNFGEESSEMRDTYYQLREKKGRSWWTFEDFPQLKSWLEENSAGIDLLGEAVRKPTFCFPIVRISEAQLTVSFSMPEIQMARDWARAVNGRVGYRIGTGDIDGAIEDTLTIYRLARHVGRQGPLIHFLVGLAIEGIADATEINGNPAFPATRDQLERLLTGIAALPPRPTWVDAIEAERYFGLGILQAQAYGYPQNDEAYAMETEVVSAFPKLSLFWIDLNVAFKRINGNYDAMIAGALNEEELTQTARPSWTAPFRMATSRGRTELFVDIQSALLFPAVNAAKEAERRSRCQENIRRITLALLLYEKDHDGRLPEGDWREAVRPYLLPHLHASAGQGGAGQNGAGREEPVDACFQCPTFPCKPDETTYALVMTEPETAEQGRGVRIPLIAELREPISWSETNGRIAETQYRLGFAPAQLYHGGWHRSGEPILGSSGAVVGSHHPGTALFGFRDGSAQIIAATDLRAFGIERPEVEEPEVDP